MNLLSLFMLCLCEIYVSAEKLGIGFVILSQSNRHHNALAEFRKRDILKQSEQISSLYSISVFKSHQDFDSLIGHWTVLPLFPKLSLSKFSWFFFLDETTNVDLAELIILISSHNHSKSVFEGHALSDDEPKIIHHFASTDGEHLISYPHFSAGFLISISLIKRLNSAKCKDCSFSIDPKYELAKYIWYSAGTKLTHESRFCLQKTKNCITWIDGNIPKCGPAVSKDKIFVGVKTCQKFHNDRVKVLQKTWGVEVKHLDFFSDVHSENIPTIKLPVQNVESGHCEKTLSILKFYVNNNIPVEWLVIVDDDTLLSFNRLRKLLACYLPNEFVALGERYGYSVVEGTGYDYLTGGSGMIFSMPTVKQLVRSCSCPSRNSPDDMIIGVCLKNFNVPVTHSPFFHQARPDDYALDFLKSHQHISFHKHWMVDPHDVYQKWLKEIDYSEHSEL